MPRRRPRNAELTFTELVDTDFVIADGTTRAKAGKIARARHSADVFRSAGKIIIADLLDGADLGAKINAGMALLAGQRGEVWTFGGNIATGVTITSDHGLRVLGPVTISYVKVVNGVGATVPPILMQSRTWLVGAGPYGANVSSIQESSDNTTFQIVNADSMVTAGFAGSNTDIHISDIKFVGYPGHADGPGFGVIHLGNCKRGSIRRVWVDAVHDLACGCGGFGTSGNRAENVSLCDNHFTDCGITLWVINGKNCVLLNNLFERCRTPIDLEPNSTLDTLRRILVAGNQIDCTGLSGTAQQAIAVQKSLAIDVGEIKVLDNTITGTNLEDATSPLVGGVTLYGVSDTTVARNTVRRAYGYGVRLQQCGRCLVRDNVNEACGGPPGGGGAPGIDVKGSRQCRVIRNILSTPAEFTGTDDPRIVEDETITVTVGTDGTIVTCVSGATFGKWLKGAPVKITGVVYTVNSVISSQTLTLTTSAGSQAGATLTYLTRDNEYRDNECLDVVTLDASNIVSTDRPWTPLSLGAALQGWFEAMPTRLPADVFQDSAGTVPIDKATDPVGFRRDLSANVRHRTQATAGNRPFWYPTGLEYDGTNDALTGSTITLSGAWTVYAVGTRATSTNWRPAAHTTDNCHLAIGVGDNNVYARAQGSSIVQAAYTGANGRILARWRRDASNSVKFAATGMAEVTLGTVTQNFTFDCEGRDFSVFAVGRVDAVVMVSADLVSETPSRDLSVRGWLSRYKGVSL